MDKLIYKKISEVMGAVGSVEKSRKNISQGYTFRGIDDMYNALNEHLAKSGLFFTSEILESKQTERQTSKGGLLIYTQITVRWTVWAEDGSSVTTDTLGEAMDSGDKSSNKAMSASYKYALMQVFCIPTEEPKDSENDSPTPAPKQTTPQKQAPSDEKTCTVCQKKFVSKYPTALKCYTCYMVGQSVNKVPENTPPLNEEIPF